MFPNVILNSSKMSPQKSLIHYKMGDCTCQLSLCSIPLDHDNKEQTYHPQALKNEKIISVDFGDVYIEGSITKPFEITNKSKEIITYYIKRNSYVNAIYRAFIFNKKEYKAQPGETIRIQITFRPLIENEKCYDCFQVFSKEKEEYFITLFLQGNCIGPRVHISTKQLVFINAPNIKQTKKSFEIKNISNIPVEFQFDIDEDDELFQVNQHGGKIEGNSSVYVTVSFIGNESNVYYKRLNCVIYKHEPIILELLARFSKTEIDEMWNFSDLKKYPSGRFSNYLQFFMDYPYFEEENVLFAINSHFFDFGYVTPNNVGDQMTQDCLLTLKNLSSEEIIVKWSTGKGNKNFSIYPKEMLVPPSHKEIFELKFCPSVTNRLYKKTFNAEIYWKSYIHCPTSGQLQEIATIPLNTEISAIGHSFSQENWIAYVETFPQILTFPPCLPGTESFATFKLKSNSDLPVLFKFLQPKNSRFSMKPLMGLLKTSRIVVVKMKANSHPAIYKEVWGLEINGKSHPDAFITLQGLSEIPSIVVGEDNIISFTTTNPGCYELMKVGIFNTSCYRLRVEIKGNDVVEAIPNNIEIAPNERVTTEWGFNAKELCPDTIFIKVSLLPIGRDNVFFGMPIEVFVKVHVKCEYSQLCCTPNLKDFGDVCRGTACAFDFQLFNFGNAQVHYALQASDRDAEVIIENAQGTLETNAGVKIVGYVTAKLDGKNDIWIVHLIRMNAQSHTICDIKPIKLFNIKYYCINPIIQIEEIADHNMGKIFSKMDIWKFFSVDGVNKMLRDIEENEIKTINLIMPKFEMQGKSYKIVFVLKNVTKFLIQASLTKLQLCNCKTLEITKGISFRKAVHVCPHRDMLQMSLSNKNIAGHSTQHLNVQLNYLSLDRNELGYQLKLSRNKIIEFKITMAAIPRGVGKILEYETAYYKRFLNMFIGSKEPPYQAFWLYNSTSQDAHYQVLDEIIHEFNEEEKFPVITCYQTFGIVPAYSVTALLFKFHPIAAKKYQVTIPLLLGDDKVDLKLVGCGVYKYDKTLTQQIIKKIPRTSRNTMNMPISISQYLIVINPFPIWVRHQELIHIKNNTSDRTFQYIWKEFEIKDFIKASASNPVGILKPKQVEAIVIKFESLNNPFIANIKLTCEILDLTQADEHMKSLKMYEEKEKMLEQYFTIDDRGYHTTPNDTIIVPLPETKYLKVDVSVHTVSPIEIFHYIDIENYLSLTPCKELELHKIQSFRNLKNDKNTESGIKLLSKSKSADGFIMEVIDCFIIDVLRSPMFDELIKCQILANPPYYSQLKIESKIEEERSIQKENSLEYIPPLSTLYELYENIIRDALLKIH